MLFFMTLSSLNASVERRGRKLGLNSALLRKCRFGDLKSNPNMALKGKQSLVETFHLACFIRSDVKGIIFISINKLISNQK